MKRTIFLTAKTKVALVALATGVGSGPLLASSGQTRTLKGTLREKGTEAPLAHVQVALVQLSDHVGVVSNRADAAGAFHLRNIPAGTYELRTNLLGYKPLKKAISFGQRRATRQLGVVALVPVVEEQVLVQPDRNQALAQVSRGVAAGRW